MNLVRVITKNQDITTSKINLTSNLTLSSWHTSLHSSFISDGHASPVLYIRLVKDGRGLLTWVTFPTVMCLHRVSRPCHSVTRLLEQYKPM